MIQNRTPYAPKSRDICYTLFELFHFLTFSKLSVQIKLIDLPPSDQIGLEIRGGRSPPKTPIQNPPESESIIRRILLNFWRAAGAKICKFTLFCSVFPLEIAF